MSEHVVAEPTELDTGWAIECTCGWFAMSARRSNAVRKGQAHLQQAAEM